MVDASICIAIGIFVAVVKFKFTFAKITRCIHARRVFSISKNQRSPLDINPTCVVLTLRVAFCLDHRRAVATALAHFDSAVDIHAHIKVVGIVGSDLI